MKLSINGLLFALAAQQAAGMGMGGCPSDGEPDVNGFECSGENGCLECIGKTDNGDGTYTVTISGHDCKEEYEDKEISWMCCAQAGCVVEGNNGSDLGKKEGTRTLVITNVLDTATSVEVDVHDGQAYGDEVVFSDSCGGNAGNSMNTKCSNICTASIDLSTCPHSPSITGDPHLKNWIGQYFDYMGECDLNLMHASKFDGEQDIDIFARTTIRYDYSFIESAALRIGSDVLEVGAWGDYALNGVEGALLTDHVVPKLGGYRIEYVQVDNKKHNYNIMISDTHNITVSSFKDWVSVKIVNGDHKHYQGVTGLMGSFNGQMIGRDGSTVFDDMDAFGQDWQIRPEEGNVFRTVRAPQYPAQCILPHLDAKTSRFLAETDAEEAAADACAGLKGNAFAFCVHDVLVSGDLDMAQAGAY